jgi:DNA-binding CsgD family transcriptional regulator
LIEQVATRATDPRGVRLSVLDILRDAVGFDYYVWMLTDPQTNIGVSPLAEVPSIEDVSDVIRLKYLTQVGRWTEISQVTTLLAATDGDLRRSRQWREILDRYGVRDVLSTTFRDAHGQWGFLDMWRTGAVFLDADAALLRGVLPVLTRQLRVSQRRQFEVHGPVVQRTSPVLLLLDSRLRPLSQTPETDTYLRTLVPPDGGAQPVPAAAMNVGAALVAAEENAWAGPAWARVHLDAGRWLTLRAARVGAGTPKDLIAVTIEDASVAERAKLFASVCGLTTRERQLLDLLMEGLDTRAVARALHLSEHTVQDHLKSIFAKTGTNSRRQLIFHAVGS